VRTSPSAGSGWDDELSTDPRAGAIAQRHPTVRAMDALICADRVLTGRAGHGYTDGGVIVEGDRITAVGTRTALQARSGDRMRVLSYPRSTLMPGLINSHVHLAFDTSGDPVRAFQASTPEQLLADMATRACLALRAGITTIRDLGDNGLVFRVRDEIASGARSGPRILASGPPLTVAGGRCWFFGGVVDDDDSIRAMVRRNAADGADLIKVMASGGQMTPGGAKMWQSQFTAEQLRVVVTEAAQAGLRVAAHAHGADAITAAVEAGVHTVEHCTWMSGPGQYDRREQIVRKMAAAGIFACAALSHNWSSLYDRLGPTRAAETFGRLAWMDGLGVPFIAGTDAGLPGAVFDNMAGALGLYSWLGFPADRIIEFATVNAASALGLADTTGQLAPGLVADLLVVEGDPLTTLDALHNVRMVMTSGTLHDCS
jgi:imidazolonepropionase-like amidohydrolase